MSAVVTTANTALERVESFVKKALAALEPWKHHPAAAEAAEHLSGAVDNVAQGKADVATAATAATGTQAAAATEQAAETPAAGTEATQAAQTASNAEGAAGAAPTA
jgi:hypothetical protein